MDCLTRVLCGFQLKALCIRLEEKEPSAAEFFVRDQQKVLEFVREKFSETVDIREVDDEVWCQRAIQDAWRRFSTSVTECRFLT